jgi:hypothetical protein
MPNRTHPDATKKSEAAATVDTAAAAPAATPVAKVVAAVEKVAPAAKPAAKVVAKPAAKTAAKPVAKVAAKPAAKVAAKVAVKPAVKSAPQAAAAPAVKPAEMPAEMPVGKNLKAKKAKMVRDSFTMPEAEYALIAAVKKRCIAQGVAMKKSEVLRAAIIAFAAQSDAAVTAALRSLDAIKTGRPPKGQK